MIRKLFVLLLAAGWLAGCSSTATRQAPPTPGKSGGYYLDDGPGDNPPPNLSNVPDAVPRIEPLHPYANRPYEVMGVRYTPMQARESLRQEGLASWYGRRYHGRKTSSGEIYDMYGMTAAHPTLPIPSYARVTAVDTGKSVIVRINDRGPFHGDRIIDLSYAAAYKLGIVGRGSARVVVESIHPEPTPMHAVTPSAPAKAETAGYYVQLGAFGNPDNAGRLQAQVLENLAIAPALVQVALVDNLHRVRIGPFAEHGEANRWVDKIRAALGIAAVIVTQ